MQSDRLGFGGGSDEAEYLDGSRGEGKAERVDQEGRDVGTAKDFPKWEGSRGRRVGGGVEPKDEAERQSSAIPVDVAAAWIGPWGGAAGRSTAKD